MEVYTLGMLAVGYALNFIDRIILVIVQERIKQDMGLSDASLGLLSGFSFALVRHVTELGCWRIKGIEGIYKG